MQGLLVEDGGEAAKQSYAWLASSCLPLIGQLHEDVFQSRQPAAAPPSVHSVRTQDHGSSSFLRHRVIHQSMNAAAKNGGALQIGQLAGFAQSRRHLRELLISKRCVPLGEASGSSRSSSGVPSAIIFP